MSTDAPRDNPITGVAVAIVRDNRDPNGLARVRVSFPWYSRPEESYLARLATPMIGKGYGTFLLPEVDDEVLVAFERGDIRLPCVVGSLWNNNRKPPVTNADGRNDIRTIRTRKGHALRFEDGVKERHRARRDDCSHGIDARPPGYARFLPHAPASVGGSSTALSRTRASAILCSSVSRPICSRVATPWLTIASARLRTAPASKAGPAGLRGGRYS